MSVEYPDITPDMLKDFEDSLSPKLKTPTENTRTRTWKSKAGEKVTQVTFRESANIDEIIVAPATSDYWGEHTKFVVKLTVTATKGSGLNIGRKVQFTGRIKPLRELSQDDPRLSFTKQALLVLTQFIRARGFDMSEGLNSAKMAAYFPIEGTSPLVNSEVEIEVANKSNNDFSEVNNVFKLVTAAADVEV